MRLGPGQCTLIAFAKELVLEEIPAFIGSAGDAYGNSLPVHGACGHDGPGHPDAPSSSDTPYMPSGVPTVAHSASVSAASVIVRRGLLPISIHAPGGRHAFL
jgi:hypothetical protein